MSELRYNKDGVPVYDGSPELFVAYQRAALTYAETIEWKKRSLVGPRLQAALEGSARLAVEHMRPGWVSHPKGASQLLEYLKRQVQAPTLAEAGRTMSRFFYGMKRRRGEGMAAWIVRHDEALLEAKRTLAEAIHEYGPGMPKASANNRTGWRPPSRTPTIEPSSEPGGPETAEAPEDGSLGENEDVDGPDSHAADPEAWSWQDSWWNYGSWDYWSWDQSSQGGSYHDWSGYGKGSQTASAQAEKFLPDFVIAWLLLQRSGLEH